MKGRFCRGPAVAAMLVCVAAAQSVEAQSVEAQTVGATRCGAGVHESEATGTVLFPDDQSFCALVADPKEPSTFISYLRGRFRTLAAPSGEVTNIATIGVGDTFGLIRFGGPAAGEGVQVDVIGAIFAQFDIGTPSTDLINTDYIIGVPLTFRRNGFSLRTKLYHQSSHLGDEYLLRDTGIERENLSFESFEVLASIEVGPLRAYGGGEHLFRREPQTMAAKVWHGGFELRTGANAAAQLIAGIDLKTPESHNWSPATSARLGVAVRRTGAEGHPGRLINFVLELYEGPSPYGQFFQDDISYVGFGVHLGL
jgi:Protein of unknown function (DUF1207)